jgi:hypothetical protein
MIKTVKKALFLTIYDELSTLREMIKIIHSKE